MLYKYKEITNKHKKNQQEWTTFFPTILPSPIRKEAHNIPHGPQKHRRRSNLDLEDLGSTPSSATNEFLDLGHLTWFPPWETGANTTCLAKMN